jgi:hypothetical protein
MKSIFKGEGGGWGGGGVGVGLIIQNIIQNACLHMDEIKYKNEYGWVLYRRVFKMKQ